ncbi:MAG: hypothetical protein ISS48_00765 [Candidatus Aenigmarchaeota archaeon]|nr:hypothetical protein [Candidatus Aenigmarchaeota archaeon]
MNQKIKLDESIREEIKELVLIRFETLNKESKIMLLGFKEPITVGRLIDEVKSDSEFGKKVVEVQYAFLRALSSGEF